MCVCAPPPKHTRTPPQKNTPNRDKWAITCDHPNFAGTGNPDTGAAFWGAPDLDHANPLLREALAHWLQHLHVGVGFKGAARVLARCCAGVRGGGDGYDEFFVMMIMKMMMMCACDYYCSRYYKN